MLADEINRATPKTQSALLEAMQERTVTSGPTNTLEAPFLVMATQNPIEMEGTYPLPEAQLDRFLMKIVVNYPSRDELSARRSYDSARRNAELNRFIDRRDSLRRAAARCWSPSMSKTTRSISSWHGDTAGNQHAHELSNRYIRYGSSPRGAQALVECGRVLALMRGRVNLSVDDIRHVASRPASPHHSEFRRPCRRSTPDTILTKIIPAITAAVPPEFAQ